MKKLLFILLFVAGICKPATTPPAFQSNWTRCALRCAAVGVRTWADLKVKHYRLTKENPEKNLQKARCAYAVRALADATFALTDPRLLHSNHKSVQVATTARLLSAVAQLHAAYRGEISLVQPTPNLYRVPHSNDTSGDNVRGTLALFDGLAAVTAEVIQPGQYPSWTVGLLSMIARFAQWNLMSFEASYDEMRLAAYGFQTIAAFAEGMGPLWGKIGELEAEGRQLRAENRLELGKLRFQMRTGMPLETSITLPAEGDIPERVVGFWAVQNPGDPTATFDGPVNIFDGGACASCGRAISKADYAAVKRIFYPGVNDEDLAGLPDLHEWGSHECSEHGIKRAISVQSCGHMACRECLYQWVGVHDHHNCPTCRGALPAEEVQRIITRRAVVDMTTIVGAQRALQLLSRHDQQP